MSSPRDAAHARSVVFLLSQIGGYYAIRFANLVTEIGLTPRGYGVLSLLDQEDPPVQQQLADALGVHRNVMVNEIDRLEAAGFVHRERDTTDRRAFRIRLTPQGADALQRVGRIVTSLDAEVRSTLSTEQATDLTDILTHLAAELSLRSGLHPSMTSAR